MLRLLCLLAATAAALGSAAATAAFPASSTRCSSPPGNNDAALWVDTTVGRVHGTVDAARAPNVRQFLGIPFGKPPVGELRFAPPKPADAFGQLEATQLPPSCMQYLGTGASVYTRDVLEFNLEGLNTTGSISEDCLTLSVWTPIGAAEGNLLPVFIYVYGGGFNTGGQNVPYQLPPQWVQRTQSHIVVSFNYRLNIFGFPNSAALDQQNLGLLDQRLAVEWTRDNVAKFGGDPARMLLWGQSAGGMSVGAYNYAWHSDPIVSGLIHDSGNEMMTASYPASPRSTNFTFVAEGVGCGGLSSVEELACMRKASAADIENFVAAYADAGTSPSLSFAPVVDEILPAIIGTNSQDGVPFVAYTTDGPSVAATDAIMLALFFCTSVKSAEYRLLAGLPTFRYLYSGNFTNIAPRPWMGAYHSAELPMIFGTHPNFRGNSTALEYETSEAMQDAWLAFARDGADGLVAQGWPLFSSLGGDVRVFGDAVAVQTGNTKAWEESC
ncbi:hypothetical protein HK405_008435 [Cladochytrium tenue]|nr:hypothetical protein HK405_008435 [Cladochytrium tenue]